MFDYYEVQALDVKPNALKGRVICKTFATYNEAKVFYDNIKKEVKYILEDKSLIFRSADGKHDKMLEYWDCRQ